MTQINRNIVPRRDRMDKGVWQHVPDEMLVKFLELCIEERDSLETRRKAIEEASKQKHKEIEDIRNEMERRRAERIEIDAQNTSLAEDGAPVWAH